MVCEGTRDGGVLVLLSAVARDKNYVYERYQSRLARLYGFINGGFRLAVEGGARGASPTGRWGYGGLWIYYGHARTVDFWASPGDFNPVHST